MFARVHLQIAVQLVQSYTGTTPFVHYLKQYFSLHKKHGSRDRKQIAQLCYCWFRLGRSFSAMDAGERMVLALFLCSDRSSPILASLNPEWNEKVAQPLGEKLNFLAAAGYIPGPLSDTVSSDAGLSSGSLLISLSSAIFPWQQELSDGIDPVAFGNGHLMQPDLFVRARPAYQDLVAKKLERAGVEFERPGPDCYRLPNGFKTETLFELNKELVIQDLNSQRAGSLVMKVGEELKQKEDLKIWDACAASGGKSLLVFDRIPGAELTVTDIRSSILHNLFQRFKQAGVYSYDGFTADLSLEDPQKMGEQYLRLPVQDLIIADLPCSGSGTWSRTPENLLCFDTASIQKFAGLQQQILKSLVPKLGQGAYLLYITCSAFKAENEKNIEWLLSRFPLECLHMQVFKGYEEKADTMFAALLQNKYS
ncbi:MAG TPA: Fmu (Sun) domain-containing protein [Flavihumibacter sp.]